MLSECTIGRVTVGQGRPLAVIAGPCVLESPQTNDVIARTLRDVCAQLGVTYIFKASYDKANRTSIHSARGPGLNAGLDELRRIRETFDVPVTTDVHEPAQAEQAAAVAALLHVPALLCRPRDLLL